MRNVLLLALASCLVIKTCCLTAQASGFRLPLFAHFLAVDNAQVNGTKWAVLVAGSNGWENYRHQVRNRTLEGTKFNGSSHVMQYGDQSLTVEFLSVYLGNNAPNGTSSPSFTTSASNIVPQRDAGLVHLQHKIRKISDVSSQEYLQAQKKLHDRISHREHVDYSINHIGNLLFGFKNGSKILKNVRSAGQPLVDDWDCLKTFVKTYEKYCGSLSTYGLKYTREVANICNAGVTVDQMAAASIKTCS
ncbi:Peptidase C13, legumain [Parasponia andersonii]|uniref:Peptidase C13, legumain n=1 Tax=Parasponia andersonii TaxID=3476 RepID=A0A2P5DZA4_PARAD|nr:Peptidase C13, legumain [Parasponia andersonii]